MSVLKVYVINRGCDAARLASTKAQLDRVNIPFERIPAVEPAMLAQQPITAVVDTRMSSAVSHLPDYVSCNDRGPMVYMPEHHRYLMAAEICCYLSHRRALETMIAAGDPAAVIFEDDIEIDDDLPAVLAKAMSLPPGPRIVKLEGVSAAHRVNIRLTHTEQRNFAMMFKPTAGSAAYFITREAAISMVQDMSPIREQYDAYLRQYWRHGVELLEVAPFPVRQLQFPTTITERRTNIDLPALPALALAVARPLHKFFRFLMRLVVAAKQLPRLNRLRFE